MDAHVCSRYRVDPGTRLACYLRRGRPCYNPFCYCFAYSRDTQRLWPPLWNWQDRWKDPDSNVIPDVGWCIRLNLPRSTVGFSNPIEHRIAILQPNHVLACCPSLSDCPEGVVADGQTSSRGTAPSAGLSPKTIGAGTATVMKSRRLPTISPAEVLLPNSFHPDKDHYDSIVVEEKIAQSCAVNSDPWSIRRG